MLPGTSKVPGGCFYLLPSRRFGLGDPVVKNLWDDLRKRCYAIFGMDTPNWASTPATPPPGTTAASNRLILPSFTVTVAGSFGRETCFPVAGSFGNPGMGRFNSPVLRAGDLKDHRHLIPIFFIICGVELPVRNGCHQGGHQADEFVFANRLRHWPSEDHIVVKLFENLLVWPDSEAANPALTTSIAFIPINSFSCILNE